MDHSEDEQDDTFEDLNPKSDSIEKEHWTQDKEEKIRTLGLKNSQNISGLNIFPKNSNT